MNDDINSSTRHPNRSDGVVVTCAMATSVYYYAGIWLQNEGIIGETTMLFVSGMTLLAGLPIAVYALLMIEDSIRGVSA